MLKSLCNISFLCAIVILDVHRTVFHTVSDFETVKTWLRFGRGSSHSRACAHGSRTKTRSTPASWKGVLGSENPDPRSMGYSFDPYKVTS